MEFFKESGTKGLDMLGETPYDVIQTLMAFIGNIVQESASISTEITNNRLQCRICDSVSQSTVTIVYENIGYDSLVGNDILCEDKDPILLEDDKLLEDLNGSLFSEDIADETNTEAIQDDIELEVGSLQPASNAASPDIIFYSSNEDHLLNGINESIFGEEVLFGLPLEDNLDVQEENISPVKNKIEVKTSANTVMKNKDNRNRIRPRKRPSRSVPYHSSDENTPLESPLKKYKCNYCTKTFSQIGNRNVHERIHTGEKPYKCNYCDKRFAQASGKRGHERTHTGEKPYNCKFCNKSFSQMNSQRVHELVHHT